MLQKMLDSYGLKKATQFKINLCFVVNDTVVVTNS